MENTSRQASNSIEMRCSFLVDDHCRRMLTVDYRLCISIARVQDETLRGIRGGHAAFLLAIKPKRNFQRNKPDAVKINSFYFGVTIGLCPLGWTPPRVAIKSESIISTGAGPGIALEVASGNSVSLVLVPSGLILKRCEQIWFMRHGTLRKHLRYSALVLCLVFGSVQWQTTDACQICRLAFAISVG
jgi:hypothetical protein